MNLKKEKCSHKFKAYCQKTLPLTTQRLALIGLLLALTTVVSLIEIPTPFATWLKVDFGNTINLMAVLIIKLPYGLLIAVLSPWLRLILPHTIGAGEVIGELSYMLSTLSLLLIYNSFYFLFKQIPFWKNDGNNHWKRLIIVEIPVAIISMLLVSLLNVFYNWAFILDLYHMGNLKNEIWNMILLFNLFKFSLVLTLYLILVRPLQVLLKHFNINNFW